MNFYLMLDGTSDVTQAKRAREAAKFGPGMLVCALPPGADPDDLEADELASVKGEARPVLEEWLDMVDGTHVAAELSEFGRVLAEWEALDPAGSGARKSTVCERMNLTPANYAAWLAKEGGASAANKHQRTGFKSEASGTLSGHGLVQASGASAANVGRFVEDPIHPGQPAPPKQLGYEEGEKRPVIKNYTVKPEKRVRLNPETNADEEYEVQNSYRMEIGDLRKQINSALNGYPMRWGRAGEKKPVLFVPDGAGAVRPLASPEQLAALCHEFADVKTKEKGQDSKGSNFIGFGLAFQHFGGSRDVPQYMGIRYKPHWPPMADTFYTWIPPENYAPEQADGRYVAAAVKLFANIKEPWMKYVYAAALITPFWGGEAGERAAFVFGANKEGRGKTKASEPIGVAAGGIIELQPGRKMEEQLFDRILSEQGAFKSVLRIDNLKFTLNSGLLESIITARELSGKKMYSGESSRPNDMMLIITMNSVKVSPDIARRAFFIHLEQPAIRGAWAGEYSELMKRGEELTSDAGHILSGPMPPAEVLDGLSETFAVWCREVLARVVAHPAIRAAVGVDMDVRQIVAFNQAWRDEANEALENATSIEGALLRFIIKKNALMRGDGSGGWIVEEIPKRDFKISPDELFEVHTGIFGKDKSTTTATVGKQVSKEIKAERITILTPGRGSSRYYEVKRAAVEAFIERVRNGDETLDTEPATLQEESDGVPEAFTSTEEPPI